MKGERDRNKNLIKLLEEQCPERNIVDILPVFMCKGENLMKSKSTKGEYEKYLEERKKKTKKDQADKKAGEVKAEAPDISPREKQEKILRRNLVVRLGEERVQEIEKKRDEYEKKTGDRVPLKNFM